MKKPNVNLSNEDALVLQQISESGEEDVVSLSEGLGMKSSRVRASIESLRRKGLVTVQRTASDWWVQVSTKGKELTRYVWPETSLSMSFS